MKKMFIKPINSLIEFDKPIIQIIFENNVDFRNFIENIEVNVIYSENDESLELNKKTIIINNIYNIDINDKKNITFLYKNIVNQLSEKQKESFDKINNELLNVIKDINNTNDYGIDFEDSFDITKILNLYQVKFCLDEQNYLEKLAKYIEITSSVSKINTFISFSLIRILSEEEVNLLVKELSLSKINLIDFDFQNSKKEIKYYEIDEDWCII